MTVKELISTLQKLPQEMKVVTEGTSMSITEYYHVSYAQVTKMDVTQDCGIEVKKNQEVVHIA